MGCGCGLLASFFIALCFALQYSTSTARADANQSAKLLVNASVGRPIPETLFGNSMRASASDVSNWTKVDVLLEAKGTNHNSRLQLTTLNKGHGFRKDLIEMVEEIKPQFIRFPGGCFVEGEWLRNAYRWKESVGPWEERPGHFGDVWMYWTDDGLGYFEFLQLSEDLGARPIWVFNNGISHNDQVDTSSILPFVQVYRDANDLFSMAHQFNRTSRSGPKAFVSEYAVNGKDAGTGSFLAALAEAGFLIGLEKNSDIVEMASYAPVLVNTNDRRWNPDAIVFNSYQVYGTPSHWVQRFFRESSGATLLNATIQTSSSSLIASTITWKNPVDGKTYLKIKTVNFGSASVNLKISVDGLGINSKLSGSTKTTLTSTNLMDENTFTQPKKVAPMQTPLEKADRDMDVVISPCSFTYFDMLTDSDNIRTTAAADSFSRSSI